MKTSGEYPFKVTKTQSDVFIYKFCLCKTLKPKGIKITKRPATHVGIILLHSNERRPKIITSQCP